MKDPDTRLLEEAFDKVYEERNWRQELSDRDDVGDGYEDTYTIEDKFSAAEMNQLFNLYHDHLAKMYPDGDDGSPDFQYMLNLLRKLEQYA